MSIQNQMFSSVTNALNKFPQNMQCKSIWIFFICHSKTSVVTPYAQSLKGHIGRKHTKPSTKCPMCSWVGNNSSLPQHNRTAHRPQSKERYKCDICNKDYPRKSHLKDHKDRAHFGVKYSCPKCDYRATITQNLKTHIKSMHEGVKKPCNQCDYKAFDNQSLTKHLKAVHLKLKPYQCTTCDFKTAIKTNLINHEKCFHLNVKINW